MSKKGYVCTPEHCRNISKGKKGFKHSEKTKKLLSEVRFKYWRDNPEAKERLKQFHRDNPEFGQALGDRVRGIPKSDIQKERMREAKLGIKKTDEHRASMRRSHLLRGCVLRMIVKDYDVTYRFACKILKQDKDGFYKEYNNMIIGEIDEFLTDYCV